MKIKEPTRYRVVVTPVKDFRLNLAQAQAEKTEFFITSWTFPTPFNEKYEIMDEAGNVRAFNWREVYLVEAFPVEWIEKELFEMTDANGKKLWVSAADYEKMLGVKPPETLTVGAHSGGY